MTIYTCLIICLVVTTQAAPSAKNDESLPFDTENFLTDLLSDSVTEDEVVEEKIQQRFKMRDMFSRGPPGIGTDLFKTAVEKSLQDPVIEEGSGYSNDEFVESPNATVINENQIQPTTNDDTATNNSTLHDLNNSDLLASSESNELDADGAKDVEKTTKVTVEAKLQTNEERKESSMNLITNENGCPIPKPCGKDCFVYINGDGCQDCQCLWIAKKCNETKECGSDNQYCDLGKCNCMNGFEQDMTRSGFCKPVQILRPTNLKDLTKEVDQGKRIKREAKPRRAERLEWPGVCDKNENCPGNLVCIKGDCWSLPEKEHTISFETSTKNSISFYEKGGVKKVSFDTDDISDSMLRDKKKLVKKRKMTRFVSKQLADKIRKINQPIKNPDWFPPTTTTESNDITNNKANISVERFFLIETTTSTEKPPPELVSDQTSEKMRLPLMGTAGFDEDDFVSTTEVSQQIIAPTFLRKIHLNTNEPILTREVLEKNEASKELEDLRNHKSLKDIFTTQLKDTEDAKPDQIELTASDIINNNSNNNNNDDSFEIDQKLFDVSPQKPYIITQRKFSTIAPLENIDEKMASEDDVDITPEPAPFDEHKFGVWYPMNTGDIPHLGIFAGALRRSPEKTIADHHDKRLYNEYTKTNRRNKPIIIEMDNAKRFVRDECDENSKCGNLTVCCTKEWCDRTNVCGTGRFCLTSCSATKLTFLPYSSHAEGVIDIIYD